MSFAQNFYDNIDTIVSFEGESVSDFISGTISILGNMSEWEIEYISELLKLQNNNDVYCINNS